MTTLRSGSATDVGKVRNSNQDVALEDPDLFAVADGMGGHVGGEVAARVAVDSLRSAFQRQPTVEGLRRAVAEANRAVWSQGQTESGLRGMGTTLTATALVEEEGGRQVIALANVGDSRAYVFSKGQVIQVTADHSLAEEKVRQGQLTEAEAAVHPHRHILTRALGVSSDVDVDLWELHLHDGDRILLCSDGLTNEIGDERIGQILMSEKDPAVAARSLVDAALDHGGSDNVTCVVIDVVGAESPAAPGKAAAAATTAGAAAAAPRRTGKGSAAGDDGEEPTADEAAKGPDGRGPGPDGEDATRTTRALRAVSSSGSRGSSGGGSSGGSSSGGSTRTRSLPRAGAAANGVADGVAGSAGATAEPGERGPGAPNGGGTRGAGALSAARLQAAELRRLQPTRDDRRYRRRSGGSPRLITFRLVLFVILLLAVVAAAYAALRWYATNNWYVGVDNDHLAVYQGRPGGFLWFKPQLVDETGVATNQVPPYANWRNRQEPSARAAKQYISNLHTEFLANSGGPTGTSAGSSSSTSTTKAALGPPVIGWQ